MIRIRPLLFDVQADRIVMLVGELPGAVPAGHVLVGQLNIAKIDLLDHLLIRLILVSNNRKAVMLPLRPLVLYNHASTLKVQPLIVQRYYPRAYL